VADDREEREVLFRLADMLGTPVCRRVSAGIGQAERRDGGGDRGRRRANDLVGQKCRERGNDDADGKRRAGSPHREPVARGPDTEHDSDHRQQHADDRGAWRVVGIGHLDSHGRDGQAEGDCRHRADESCALNASRNRFDSRAVAWHFGERRVAGDERRVERLRRRHVHGVVRSDVFTQLPRASQEIEMGMTVQIEFGEIRNRFGRSVR
jgi:hypothetical protein